jgi:hypothetical protein
MKRHPGICLTVILVLAAVLFFGSTAAAWAHSTKGRIKIPLDKTEVGIDDVAYFVESYVHRQLYKDRYAQSKRRFYVKEFVRVEQKDRQAVVRFIVLDLKENASFPDAMTIERGTDGVWRYPPENGPAPVEIYTYVMKWGYYYKRYVLPISAAGAGLALFFLAVLRLRNRKKGATQCEA